MNSHHSFLRLLNQNGLKVHGVSYTGSRPISLVGRLFFNKIAIYPFDHDKLVRVTWAEAVIIAAA
jgi:hypothetical protein